MKPVAPAIQGLPETVFAKDQPEYNPLPCYRRDNGDVVTRWECTFWDRLRILFLGNVYLTIKTFGQPLQPVLLQSDEPQIEDDSIPPMHLIRDDGGNILAIDPEWKAAPLDPNITPEMVVGAASRKAVRQQLIEIVREAERFKSL